MPAIAPTIGPPEVCREHGRVVHLLVLSLWLSLAARDLATALHARRVARHAVRTARALGLPRAELRVLLHAGLLHDVGKLNIDDAVLRKPGPLDVEERRHIERHVEAGGRLLAKFPVLDPVARLVAYHHEWFSGEGGYPTGLARENLPLGSRILSVCDVFDSLKKPRPYREAMPTRRIKEHLVERAGTQFDPDAVRAFFRQLSRARVVRTAVAARVNGRHP